jgi:hypothetical protein
MIDNFVKIVLENGGTITPLLIPSENTNGTGLCNPSIYIDNDKILVNLRHIQYTLFHSELNRFEHQYGPLVYLHPENDLTLTTTNYLCELDPITLEIQSYTKVDTSKLDIPPVWEFIGLEDARLVKWDGKLYMCGVRRDTKPNGEGRMELSEIVDGKEVSRFRIEPPIDPNSYCEKNWMPILDMPYHFVKWTNPTEVVKVYPEEGRSEQVHLGQYCNMPADLRGGSQVIPFGEGYLTLNHETYLYNSEQGRKDGTYKHRFTYWDKNWNILKFSDNFSFLDAKIEFACGLAKYKENYLITFGFQDNASYLLKIPAKFLENFIHG